MRTRLISVALALAAAGCGGSDSTSSVPTGGTPTGTTTVVATTSVAMQANSFTPPDIQVAPGAVVTWTNSDGIDHNVTFSSGVSTGTGNFSTGSKTLTMPATPGTYSYHCTIHGAMTGTVLVK